MRKLLLAAAFVFLAMPCRAQMAVIDAGMNSLLASMKADQAIYWANSLVEMYNSAQNTYNQFQNMLRAEERAMKNLQNISNVKNFDDFMKWQNRQLYLEREAENRFMNMSVKVGGSEYRLADVQRIPGALKEEYVDYWEQEFTEAQRQKMWTQLGLSPSNYVYVKTWQAREEAIAQRIMSMSDIINADNMKAYDKWKKLNDEYLGDKDRPEDEKIQEKRLLMDIASILMDTNILQRSMAYDNALKNEMEHAQNQLGKTPASSRDLSDMYNAQFMRSMSDEKITVTVIE